MFWPVSEAWFHPLMGSTWDTATNDLPHKNSPLLDIGLYN
jgi:hypothetical protein